MAEAVMTELVRNGMNRQVAHELLRELSMKAYQENKPLFDELIKNKKIMQSITEKELKAIFDHPENYLGTAKEQIEIVLLLTEKAISK